MVDDAAGNGSRPAGLGTSRVMLQVVLAVLGLTLAWTTFRIGHDASLRREIAAARGMLTAVRAGIVEHDGGKSWGEAYLSTPYTDVSAASRAMLASEGVVRGTFDQVFVVPTEPLELLARAAPAKGFISVDTVAAANIALWRLHVFNQLVGQQTLFNALHVIEIVDRDTPPERKSVLGDAARAISFSVHRHGIGMANAERGWYRKLKDGLQRDIDALRRREAQPWWRRGLSEPAFAAVDVIAWGGLLTALVLALA
jgi:hypothetical protein